MDLTILPECFIDTNLIETLVPPVKGYNHQMGCGTVSRKMQTSLSDSFALGIVDKDKRELDYLKEFNEIIMRDGLCLLKHKMKPHYFIQIQPAIERFLMKNAEAAGLSLAIFDLPTDLNGLKKVAKTTRSKHDQRFKALFKALKNSHVADIEVLTKWVTYLKEYNYSAEIDILKRM
jgi:hypothetical protein